MKVILDNFLTNYLHQIDANPFISSLVQGTCIMISGDFMAQTLIEGRRFRNTSNKFDIFRFFRLFIMGLFIAQPIFYLYVYKFLPHLNSLPYIKDLNDVNRTIVVMIFDQTVWACSFNLLFMFLQHFFEFRDFKKGVRNAQDLIWDVQMKNYILWPGVVFLNLYYVPLKFRLLVLDIELGLDIPLEFYLYIFPYGD